VTEELETHDIQGLLRRGYKRLTEARFLLLAVVDAARAREYLQGLHLTVAADSPENLALHVAFTASGLAALGVPDTALRTFSREFLEGMDEGVRADTLGDRGDNDPSMWEWGHKSKPVHVLLLVYAETKKILEHQLTKEREALARGFEIVHEKETTSLFHQKEHFGWTDGISMPNIAGMPRDRLRKKKQESWTDEFPPGEFVLGYRNDYGAFTECPTADPADDPANHLPFDGERKSLGRNGTYLVYRELTQDVLGFWNYLATHSREPGGDPVAKAIALGAKMVGRWPSGAPLVLSPDKDRSQHATANAFTYCEDLVGTSCPPGSHIRRSNPRDVLAVEDRDVAASISMVRKHQMLRRGRPFGPPVSAKLDPREILAARPDDTRRGLHFICLVGNIGRQFEFVQRAWINSANFDSMFKDGDPISAARRRGDNANDEFTCPATPVRRKYKQLPQFTRLVGGAYFFLPGRAALRFISRHP
jgi:Dyp-type peroxidase family